MNTKPDLVQPLSDHYKREPIRTWIDGDFRLELYDPLISYVTPIGQRLLAYEFFHRGELIFAGTDYGCSPLHAIDSDDSVFELLGFLSLIDDTFDKDYEASYTPEQLAWVKGVGDELSWLCFDHMRRKDEAEDRERN